MDWAARIARAEKRGRFTLVDKRLAEAWISCAVGEHRHQYQESIYSLQETAAPESAALTHLGQIFYAADDPDGLAEARKRYDDIQRWFKRAERRAARRDGRREGA